MPLSRFLKNKFILQTKLLILVLNWTDTPQYHGVQFKGAQNGGRLYESELSEKNIHKLESSVNLDKSTSCMPRVKYSLGKT